MNVEASAAFRVGMPQYAVKVESLRVMKATVTKRRSPGSVRRKGKGGVVAAEAAQPTSQSTSRIAHPIATNNPTTGTA
jgi:hypothetical protein